MDAVVKKTPVSIALPNLSNIRLISTSQVNQFISTLKLYKYEIFSIILLIILCLWVSHLNKFNNAYH